MDAVEGVAVVVEAGAGGFEVFLVEAEGLVEVAEVVFAGGPVPGELVADFGGQVVVR